jgi:hypothetical protein
MSYIVDPITNELIDLDPKEKNLGRILKLQPMINLNNSSTGVADRQNQSMKASAGNSTRSPALPKNSIKQQVINYSPNKVKKENLSERIERLVDLYDDPGPIKNNKLNPKQYKMMMDHLVRKK